MKGFVNPNIPDHTEESVTDGVELMKCGCDHFAYEQTDYTNKIIKNLEKALEHKMQDKGLNGNYPGLGL